MCLDCMNILLDQFGQTFLGPQDILVSHQIWEEIHVLWYYLIFSGGPIHQVKKMTRIWSLEQLVIQTHPEHNRLEIYTNPWNNWKTNALMCFGELLPYIWIYPNHLFHCYACLQRYLYPLQSQRRTLTLKHELWCTTFLISVTTLTVQSRLLMHILPNLFKS